MNSDRRRIFKNSIIYSIRQVMSIIFPLITYAYVSRILGVDNVGKVNYAHSIVTYFVILAGLGISTYAIREGARRREDRNRINRFVSEIFWLNVISTIISISLLFLVIFGVRNLREYRELLLIFSLLVPFTTLGLDWVYSIYEDFKYITIRSIAFQIISLVLLFTLVKNEDDVVIYAGITVFSTVGSNILNFVHARKYISLTTAGIQIKPHLKAVFFLFGMTIATTIYTTMDTTMLGAMKGDYQVGLYSVAHKIPKVIVQTIAVIRHVSLPSLSSYSQKGGNDYEYRNISNEILGIVVLLAAPIAVALICSADTVLMIFSGSKFLAAAPTLRLLAVDIFFSALSGTLVYQYVLLKKGENAAFYITLIGTLANLILNYVLISNFEAIGAALATCLSEFVVSFLSFRQAVQYIDLHYIKKQIFYAGIGCASIAGIYLLIVTFFGKSIISVIAAMILAAGVYLAELYNIKGNPLRNILILIAGRFRK